MAEAKANKWEILDFIDSRETIISYELAETFDYTYSYACKKLSLLKRQGLVRDIGNTPVTYRGQWCLTDKGQARLHYLCHKLGVLTERENRKWRAWFGREMEKTSKERRIWVLDEDGLRPRLTNPGEYGLTIEEVGKVISMNKEQMLYEALSKWDGQSFPKDEILQSFFLLITARMAEKRSWTEISREVEGKFGARLPEIDLRYMFNLYKSALKKPSRST